MSVSSSVRRRAVAVLAVLASVLGLAGLSALAAPAAQAATVATGPSAIAVAPSGVTYVGFAAGGDLTRVDASGAVISPFAIPNNGPVDGLAVDASNNVWVGTGTTAYEYSPAGTELREISYRESGPHCPSDTSVDPTQYGGIAVSPTSLYVSDRCSAYVERYALDGTFQAAIPLSTRTRGVAYGAAQNGQPAKVYLVQPDSDTVLVYDAAFTGSSKPLFTLTVPKAGPNTPRPAGVAVDKYGQLAVTDVANDYVLLFDTNNVNGTNSYSWYRTLGRPGSNAGDISDASAISQYPVDGPLSDRQGDYFIADTGNNRIQRWNNSGYTYWTAATAGSGSGGGGGTGPSTPPVNTARPVVSGTPAVGQTLSCSNGEWSGSPTSYSYGWNRNGSYINGQTNNTYAVTSADAGQQISCFVRATNAKGTSDYATSDNVTIATSTAAPTNSSPPTISGTAQQGQTLTCSNGTWTGSPTFTRVWSRNGTAISGATGTTYVVTASDVGQAITCRVTATNSGGSTNATSAAVTPTGTSTSACTGVADTVSINNGAAYTTSESVTLTIRPPSGATQVSISNDGGYGNATTQALSGTCTYAWTLALTGNNRDTKVVYVRFLNSSGAEVSSRATDDIVLDKTAPTTSAASAARVGTSRTYAVRITAHDTGSGLARVQYAATRNGKGTTTRYRSTFRTRTPAKFAWIRVYDKAGNVSAWRHTARR